MELTAENFKRKLLQAQNLSLPHTRVHFVMIYAFVFKCNELISEIRLVRLIRQLCLFQRTAL